MDNNNTTWGAWINAMGLEYNDEFMISGDKNHVYRFTHYALQCRLKDSTDWVDAYVRTLVDIVNNEVEIMLLDWTPKVGESYYSYTFADSSSCDTFMVVELMWVGSFSDFMRYKLDLVFKTRDAAMHALSSKEYDFLNELPEVLVEQGQFTEE